MREEDFLSERERLIVGDLTNGLEIVEQRLVRRQARGVEGRGSGRGEASTCGAGRRARRRETDPHAPWRKHGWCMEG